MHPNFKKNIHAYLFRVHRVLSNAFSYFWFSIPLGRVTNEDTALGSENLVAGLLWGRISAAVPSTFLVGDNQRDTCQAIWSRPCQQTSLEEVDSQQMLKSSIQNYISSFYNEVGYGIFLPQLPH